MADERKRDIPLPPGTYAYVLDSTKGIVKLFVGPVVITPTGQDRPIKYNPETFRFDECGLEESLQQNIVVPEGFYAVLTNPAKDNAGKMLYPSEGQTASTPALAIGLKENRQTALAGIAERVDFIKHTLREILEMATLFDLEVKGIIEDLAEDERYRLGLLSETDIKAQDAYWNSSTAECEQMEERREYFRKRHEKYPNLYPKPPAADDDY